MESRILVTHFTSTLDPKMGGIPTGIVNICENLKSFGVNGRVISAGNTKRNLLAAQPRIKHLQNLGISVSTYTSPVANSYGFSPRFILRKKIRNERNEHLVVLHQIYTFSTLFGYLYARKNQIPIAVFPHGSLTKYHSRDSQFKKFLANKMCIDRILRKSDLIIVTCESEFHDLSQLLQEKTRIIPYAILTEGTNRTHVSNKSEIKEGLTIIFSGRFHQKKNIPLILRALPKVISVFPKVRLKLAGDGSATERQLIETEIDKNSIASNVDFVGWLEGKELRSFYSSGDLLVLPSFNENFALVVTEALQAGVPCIVSKNVGTADIIERSGAGLVLSRLTHEDLAEAIVEVLSKGKQFYLEAIDRALIDELNPARIAKKWLNVIQQLHREKLLDIE